MVFGYGLNSLRLNVTSFDCKIPFFKNKEKNRSSQMKWIARWRITEIVTPNMTTLHMKEISNERMCLKNEMFRDFSHLHLFYNKFYTKHIVAMTNSNDRKRKYSSVHRISKTTGENRININKWTKQFSHYQSTVKKISGNCLHLQWKHTHCMCTLYLSGSDTSGGRGWRDRKK